MGIDLKKFELPDDRGVMEVLDPDSGEPLIDEESKKAITITLLSTDSKEFKRNERMISQRYARRRGRLSVDELQTDRAVAATVEWTPPDVFEADGQPLDCKMAKDVRILYDNCPWLRDDVVAFINDRGNYGGN